VHTYPADIDLVEGGDWPAQAVAEGAGITVAAAGDVGPGGALGIDFHRLGGPSPSSALTADEQRSLGDVSERLKSEWTARVVCAKRAAAQALASTGNGPEKPLTVSGVDTHQETVQLSVEGVHIDVATIRDEDFVVAIATWKGKE
jgi:VCBS repeat-containing protein